MAPQGKPLCGKESHMDPLHVRFSSQTVESVCFTNQIPLFHENPVSSVRPSEASSGRFLCFHPDSGGLLEIYWEYIENYMGIIWELYGNYISNYTVIIWELYRELIIWGIIWGINYMENI